MLFFPPKGRKGYLPKRLRTSGDSGLTGSSPRLDSLSPSTQRDRRTSEESVEHVCLPILLLLLLLLFMLLLNILLLFFLFLLPLLLFVLLLYLNDWFVFRIAFWSCHLDSSITKFFKFFAFMTFKIFFFQNEKISNVTPIPEEDDDQPVDFSQSRTTNEKPRYSILSKSSRSF